MPTYQILALLIAERDKLTRAIEALGGGKRRGRPPKSATATPQAAPKKRGRTFTAAQRKQQAERMNAYWVAKRKARAKPKAVRARKTAKA